MDRRPVAADLCYGVRSIAEALGVKPRQALRLVEDERIPFWREGRTICARRSSLLAWTVTREAQAMHRRDAARDQREPEGAAA